MEFVGAGAVIFFVGIFFFFAKYLFFFVVHKGVKAHAVALSRFILVVTTLCVLLLPHDNRLKCLNWKLPPNQILPSAVIVAIGELWSTFCHARCGAVLCGVALVHCIIHAHLNDDAFASSSCSSAFTSFSIVGLMCSTVLFFVEAKEAWQQ